MPGGAHNELTVRPNVKPDLARLCVCVHNTCSSSYSHTLPNIPVMYANVLDGHKV